MRKHEIINLFIRKFNYKSYLEIGVLDGNNFVNIDCPRKDCVDPTKRFSSLNYEMTSDEFFERNRDKTYDVIFIDGHHDSEYVHRDINNALRQLNNGGTIFVHDCLPPTKEASIKYHDKITWCWCGDGYKVIRSIVKDYGDKLQCSVVNTDWGVGIIRKKNEDIVRVEYEENYPWETMVTEYASALNVISPEQLIASLG
jgi:hypothetical protein